MQRETEGIAQQL